MAEPILRVAVPSPLFRVFDYMPPRDWSGALAPGMRLDIPFGRGRSVGVLIEIAASSASAYAIARW